VPNDTVTLAVSGEVSLDDFKMIVERFASLIDAISAEVAKEKPDWIVDYLDAGSATLTFVGQAHDQAEVDRVVAAYAKVGRSLAEEKPVPFSPQVERAARQITGVLDGRITSVRFETADETATVVSPSVTAQGRKLLHAYGAIEGRIQTLSSRGGLRFVLYDSLFGRAVYCYLDPGREEMMRGAWDRRATVEGWVSREPVTGRPVSVRHVSRVELIDDIPRGSYRRARGVVPARPNDPPPEDGIRVLRDAS